MAAPVGSLVSTHSVAFQEVLSKAFDMYLPALDGFWTKSILSSMGVIPVDRAGRDWKILKVFMGSLSGVVEPGGPTGDFTLYGDPADTLIGPKVHTKGVVNTFPNPLEGPNATPYRLGIPMRTMLTNLALHLEELQAEATKNIISEIVAPKLSGHARQIAMMCCNYFYLSQNSYYSLAYLGGSEGAGWSFADGNRELTVDLKYSNYAVDRFAIGMRFQIYNSTGATARTYDGSSETILMCTKVDETTGKVSFRQVANQPLTAMIGGGASPLAAGDVIVFARSKGNSSTPFAASPYFTGFAGIRSWVRAGDESNPASDDNYLLGPERDSANGISVLEHPEFRSIEKNRNGQPLTESFLRQLLRRFHASKGKYGHTIDTLIASDGVWMAYEEQLIGRQYWDRGGSLPPAGPQGMRNSSMEDAGFAFQMDGRRYTCMTSQWIESGTVYGIKHSGSNWKRYSPPGYKGLKNDPKQLAPLPFQFVGGAIRGDGIHQLPIYKVTGDLSRSTMASEMPGMLRMQVIPDQVTGIIITNCQESRIYNDE